MPCFAAQRNMPRTAQTFRVGLTAGWKDLADALHLALSQDGQGLMTFDKAFASKANRLALHPAVTHAWPGLRPAHLASTHSTQSRRVCGETARSTWSYAAQVAVDALPHA